MVVDTSALTALIIGEPERELFEEMILSAAVVMMSAVSVVEVSIVLRNKRLEAQAERLDEILDVLRIDVRGADRPLTRLAREGYARFGKGRHPAGLNFGDCFP